MWSQTYLPLGTLGLSALLAVLPVALMLYLLAVARKPAWLAGCVGCAAAMVLALFAYRMPLNLALSAMLYGIANGLLPIGWIVFTAILMYRLAVETGKFEIIKDSIGNLTSDRFMQALLIAFAFGAFIEGASGFGTPVAVAAAMLVGLGMEAFYAAGICLLANTAPVAFGAIGTPIVMLQSVTGIPLQVLSADVGRVCAPLSLFIPAYLVAVMGGRKALAKAGPTALVCGVVFASTQFMVSSFVGPHLTDIMSSMAAIGAMVIICRLKKNLDGKPKGQQHSAGQLLLAWCPYIFLVVFVLILNGDQIAIPKPYDFLWPTSKLVALKAFLNHASLMNVGWPGLDLMVSRIPPVVKAASPYAAKYTFNPLTASGTAALYAVFASALVLRVSPGRLVHWTWVTMKQLALPTLTIVSVLGLAYLMNYSGATGTLGLTFAATGAAFPFFSAILGWVGVFLTGSDTSANALFGNLQVVTATKLGLNPALMAASNSAGGVMGKMLSLQSIAVAAAATGLTRVEQAKLMRFTVKHSIFLAAMIGLVTLFYAYVMPGWVR
jgi:L-lactate transport